MCISEMIKPEIFSKKLHLKLSWMLQFGSRPETLEQKLTVVPTWDLNKDYLNDVLSESSSSRLEQSLPKLYFIRSSNLGQVKSYTL